MDDITIGPVTTQEEYLACEDIQRTAWRTGDEEVVPGHMLRAIRRHGGVLLGAYTPSRQMVGFVCGFIAKTDDAERIRLMGSTYMHYSHMMGIHPDYQSRAIGTRLKWAQREHVLTQGYKLIVWTYDPLLGPNARLNIEKLGTICRHYVRNAYGDMEGIYHGLPTDRFEVEWWLTSRRVQDRLAGRVDKPGLADWLNAGARLVNPSVMRSDGSRKPGSVDALEGHMLLVEIPGDFNAIRDTDLDLARDWRLHIREVCEAAFAAGYVVGRLVSERTDRGFRNYYVLLQEVDYSPGAEGER